MRVLFRRALWVVGLWVMGGPVQAQDRGVVPAPILTTDYQKPSSLPAITTSNLSSPPAAEGAPGGGHGGAGGHSPIKDVTPPFIPGRSEPVPEAHNSMHAQEMGGWFAFGEVLLMKPRRTAADFGIVDGTNDLIPRGKSESVLYNTSPGFRVGVGYGMGNGWSVALAYTNLRNSDQRSLVAPPGGIIYPTLTRPGLIDTVSSANGDVNLEYNVFDLEMRKRVMVDETFQMAWGGGLKMASIRQELNAFYNGRDASSARVNSLNDFYGVGPTFGGETRWVTMGGLSFYSKGSAGLLVGDMKTGLSETNNRGATVNADLQDKFAKVVPVVNAGVGVSYCFRNVKASLGYEVTNYFGLIQRPQFTNDFAEGKYTTRNGDFSLDGFTFRVGVDY